MKHYIITGLLLLSFVGQSLAQSKHSLKKETVTVGETAFYYHTTDKQSESVVILFHDWFGVSGLSYEMVDRVKEKGMDVVIVDLYKGKTANTNAEAGGLMNSIDQAHVWDYLDVVVERYNTSYKQVYLWGFSLGTMPASQLAIKHHDKVKGLVLFYGNVTRDEEKLAKLTFPSLMVMGSKDNPKAAINFHETVDKLSANSTLFIYPNARHAFAQKLFNAGRNYDEKAKEASLQVAFTFLKGITN